MPKISALEAMISIDDADQLPINDVSAVTTKRLSLAGLVLWLQSKIGWITTAMLANGAVTLEKMADSAKNRPIFSGYQSTNLTAYSGIQKFGQSFVDTANAWNNTTGLYTCPIAGLYYVNYTGFIDTSGGAGGVHIRKNGTNISRTYDSSASAYRAIGIQQIIPCAAGDTLAIFTEMVMHANQANQLSIIYMGTI